MSHMYMETGDQRKIGKPVSRRGSVVTIIKLVKASSMGMVGVTFSTCQALAA